MTKGLPSTCGDRKGIAVRSSRPRSAALDGELHRYVHGGGYTRLGRPTVQHAPPWLRAPSSAATPWRKVTPRPLPAAPPAAARAASPHTEATSHPATLSGRGAQESRQSPAPPPLCSVRPPSHQGDVQVACNLRAQRYPSPVSRLPQLRHSRGERTPHRDTTGACRLVYYRRYSRHATRVY